MIRQGPTLGCGSSCPPPHRFANEMAHPYSAESFQAVGQVADLPLPSVVDMGQVNGARPRPIGVQPAHFYVSVKAGLRPIAGALYIPVLDRIQMDIIAVSEVILLVANPVLPIAGLPDAAASLTLVLFRHLPVAPARSQVVTRESPLDLSPPFGKVIVVLGKGPNAVQVIRKQHDGRNLERQSSANGRNRRP